MKPTFSNSFSSLQLQVINRLAAIEKQDADTCAGCSGEDCVCCELYHDRMRWVEPEELFADDYHDDFRFDEDDIDEFDE